MRRTHRSSSSPWWITGLVVAMAGCHADTAGVPCQNSSNCPSGYTCNPATSTCVPGSADSQPAKGDAAQPDMRQQKIDAQPPDSSPPDMPLMTCPMPVAGTFYVDASSLAPAPNGSQACPFPSITLALAMLPSASSAWTIEVEPGTYQAPLETFPLTIPGNVTVTGDVSAGSSRSAFVIDGSGPFAPRTGGSSYRVAVVLRGTIQFLTLRSSSGGDAVVMDTASINAQMALDTVDATGVAWGVALLANDGDMLTIKNQTDIGFADQDGIYVDSLNGTAVPMLVAKDTSVHHNKVDGVHVLAGSVALGPGGTTCSTACVKGTCPSPGLACTTCPVPATTSPDRFYCNGSYDVESPNVPVDAEQNYWNVSPPSCSTGGWGRASVDGCLVNTSCPLGQSPGACP